MDLLGLALLTSAGTMMLSVGWYGWRMRGRGPELAFAACGAALLALAAIAAWGGF